MPLELVEAASCSYASYTSPSLTSLWSLFSFRQLIAYSSVSGEGRQFLWKQIMLGLFDDDADGLTFSLSLFFSGFLSLPPRPRARALFPLFLSLTLSSLTHARAHTHTLSLSLSVSHLHERIKCNLTLESSYADDSLGVSDDEIAEGDSEDDDGDAVVAKLI